MKVADYHILETLSKGEKSTVYLAKSPKSEQRVVLKVASTGDSARRSERLLRNEYEMTRYPGCPLEPLEWMEAEQTWALARPYMEGITWKEVAQKHRPALDVCLRLSIQAAAQLDRLHQQGLIHKDLHPGNMLVSNDLRQVTLLDYGMAATLDLRPQYVSHAGLIDGVLPYISPEQTGRMNRVVDYRCDLYALGVVLYELFTGMLPFRSAEPLELMHSHLARTPAPLTALQPDIPPVLSRIVLKLLAKNAEDRYQSAARLQADLHQCLHQWEATGQISDFDIALHDVPLRFRIPQKLYGREKERAELLAAFEKVAAGRKQLALVSGWSGAGKTALVADVHIPLTEHQGLYITGKFEQYQRNIPYLAWRQAFAQLTEQLMTQGPGAISYWRQRLTDVLGDLTRVVTSVVPSLEKIVGPQPDPPNLSSTEVQNRFNYALRTFLRVLCIQEHPLVIFLDDFQWADAASLNLLRLVMTEPGLGHFMVIAAYRENEVHEGHPFNQTIESLQAEWYAINETDTSLAFAPDNHLITRLSLNALTEQDLGALVADTLDISPEKTAELAHIVFEKTRGNAYFVHRFLESLHHDGHIRLDTTDGQAKWVIQTEDIRALRITDNVADLLTRKVSKLNTDTRQLMGIASCLGHSFDLGMLSIISHLPTQSVEGSLWEAAQEGLLQPLHPEYRFLGSLPAHDLSAVWFSFAHDRVRQTIYDVLPDSQKHYIHQQAALILLEKLQASEQNERLFELANHLNVSGEEGEGMQELRAHYNFEAGKKAKASAAYEPAFNFFQQALAALPPQAWKTEYARTHHYHIQAAETAYLSGHDEDMERLLDIALQQARTPLDKVAVLEIRTHAHFTRQRIRESIAVGIEALALLGMKVPTKPNQAQVVLELLKTKALLRGKKPRQFLDMPLMEQPEDLAVMRIMTYLAPAMFFVDTNQFAILMFRKMLFTVQHGICSSTAYAISNYGFVLCGITHEVELGHAYGQLTLEIMKRYPFAQYQSRAYFLVYYFIEHWKQPLSSAVPKLKAAYHHSLESGEADFTAFLGNAYTQACIISGYDLEEIDKELRRQLQYSTQTRQFTSVTFNNLFHQFVLCLRNQAPEPHLLRGEMYDSDALLEEMVRIGNAPTLFNIAYLRYQLSLLFGHYEAAVKEVVVAQEHLRSVISIPVFKHHALWSALARTHICLQDKSLKNKHIGQIKEDIATLRRYQKFCPDDFTGKVALAEAGLAAMQGEHDKALSKYNEAVSDFLQQGNAYDQALGYLEIFRYAHMRHFNEMALTYHRKAVTAFRRWGAEAMALHLEAMPGYTHKSEENAAHTLASGARREVDLYSIIKGSQVISSELDLQLLLPKMLGVMAENAGAERGALILLRSSGPCVEAEMREAGVVCNFDTLTPYTTYEGASTAVVNYVLHSGQHVVLDNAMAEGRFVNDSYVRSQRVRSLLCMNLLHKGQSVGVLYLENNLVPGAFTAGRMEVLQILGTQAAISIENARYYADIQNLNRAYERFVPREFLQQLNRNSILDISLGDQAVRDMAVMFSDIWGFTTISESVSTEEVFALLNDIWGRLTPVIEAHGGLVDKFIGDAVMALFPSSAQHALHAAVEIQRKLAEFNQERKAAGLFPIHMGIGLNSGRMILGTVGASSRLDTTVIGDAVNIASRLEDMTRPLQTYLLVSADLVDCLHDAKQFQLRCVGELPIRGKSQTVRIFEEYSHDAPALAQAKTAHRGMFARIIEAAAQGDAALASQLASTYLRQVPHDGTARFYLESSSTLPTEASS